MSIKKKLFFTVRKIGRLFYHGHIWLISDRKSCAGDNGEAMFLYLKDKKVKTVFAISKEAKDYERLKKIGGVVAYDSKLYKLLLCIADVHISSQLIHMESHEETPQVFLQHGISNSNISKMLNPASHKNFYVITTTKKEYEEFCSSDYLIDNSHIWLTGLPRMDYYYNENKGNIVISFTWRKELQGLSDEKFKNTDYYKRYMEIISDKSLKEYVHKKSYSLGILLHPEMKAYLKVMDIPEGVQIINEPYRKMFAHCSMLITDYSSIASDVAYLKKPVIYYQFDKSTFYNESRFYTKGAFDYTKDGYGRVVYTYDKLKEAIINSINNNCQIEEKYLKRVEDNFVFFDGNNSRRVFEKIIRIKNIKN